MGENAGAVLLGPVPVGAAVPVVVAEVAPAAGVKGLLLRCPSPLAAASRNRGAGLFISLFVWTPYLPLRRIEGGTIGMLVNDNLVEPGGC